VGRGSIRHRLLTVRYDGKGVGSVNRDTVLDHSHPFVDSGNGDETFYLYLRTVAGNDGFVGGAIQLKTGDLNSVSAGAVQAGGVVGRKGIETAPVWGAVLFAVSY